MKNTISTATKAILPLLLFLLSYTASAQTPKKFTQLRNPANFSLPSATTADITALENAAASLLDSFPIAAYRDSFQVYDFSFYFIQEDVKESYPEALARQLTAVEAKFPYYLLFGRGLNRETGEVKFWVEIKLPTTAEFGCMTAQRRAYYKSFIEGKVNVSSTNGITGYSSAEIAAMSGMAKMLKEDFECCFFSRSGGGCGQFALSEVDDMPYQIFSEPTTTNEAYAITPDGNVLLGLPKHPTHPNYDVRAGISSDMPYVVMALLYYDESKKLVEDVRWSTEDNKAGFFLNGTRLGEIKTASPNDNWNVDVFHLFGNGCLWGKQKINWSGQDSDPTTLLSNEILAKINTNAWDINAYKKKPGCDAYERAQKIFDRDNSNFCNISNAEAQREVNDLLSFSNVGENDKIRISQLATKIANSCLSSLEKIPLTTKLTYLRRVGLSAHLSEVLFGDEEIAILRLLLSFKTNEYKHVYDELEANNNALIINIVNKIDDTVLLLYGSNNYSNFIGGLCWMYSQEPRALEIDTADFTNYQNILEYSEDEYGFNPSWNEVGVSNFHRMTFSYSSENGKIYVYDNLYKCKFTILEGDCFYQLSTDGMDHSVYPFNPLDPVYFVYTDYEDDLVKCALEDSTKSVDNKYLVPAIFLKYRLDKHNAALAASTAELALDVVTIYSSGGLALTTKLNRVKRIWALLEVAGSSANIALKTVELPPNSKLKTAVDILNITLAAVGVKNLAVGGYKAGRNLTAHAKNLSTQPTWAAITTGLSIKPAIFAHYWDWRQAIIQLDNISDAEKQLVISGKLNKVDDLKSQIGLNASNSRYLSLIEKESLVEQSKIFKRYQVYDLPLMLAKFTEDFSATLVSRLNTLPDNLKLDFIDDMYIARSSNNQALVAFFEGDVARMLKWNLLSDFPKVRINITRIEEITSYLIKNPNTENAIKQGLHSVGDYVDEFLNGIKNATEDLTHLGGRSAFPNEISSAVIKIQLDRKTFNISKTKNLGYLEGQVNGVDVDTKIWSSGPVQPGEPEIFNAIDVGGWERTTDSEYKMLNYFAFEKNGILGNSYPLFQGTLKIVSERPYCVSCQGVIQQFHSMFPNINLILVDGVKAY